MTVHYVAGIYETGEEIESAWVKGNPYTFTLGAGYQNPGWEEGLKGMRVGGRRALIIPTTPEKTPIGSELGDTLVYVVDLLAVTEERDPTAGGSTGSPTRVIEGVEPEIEAPDGPVPTKLAIKDLVRGSGPAAKTGDGISVQFVGLRWTGEPFQSSWETGEPDPFTFELGARQVIPGWERGLLGMRAGGRREIDIPSNLVYYGESEAPAKLNPEKALLYVVDLLAIE